jgi:hypothetical protein
MSGTPVLAALTTGLDGGTVLNAALAAERGSAGVAAAPVAGG